MATRRVFKNNRCNGRISELHLLSGRRHHHLAFTISKQTIESPRVTQFQFDERVVLRSVVLRPSSTRLLRWNPERRFCPWTGPDRKGSAETCSPYQTRSLKGPIALKVFRDEKPSVITRCSTCLIRITGRRNNLVVSPLKKKRRLVKWRARE